MANVLWPTSLSWTTYLTTELNSLASAGNKLGGAISPSGERWMALLLDLAAQGSNRASGAHVAVFVLPSDDTTFAYGSDSLLPSESHREKAFILDSGVTTARFDVVVGIPIPPGDFKILVRNVTGVAFAASGNTVKYALYTEQV